MSRFRKTLSPANIMHRLRTLVGYSRQHPVIALGLACCLVVLGAAGSCWINILRNYAIIQSVEYCDGDIGFVQRSAPGLEYMVSPGYRSCFGDIKTVCLLDGALPAILAHDLARLNKAESIMLLNSGVDDSQLRSFSEMTSLKELAIGSSNMSIQGASFFSSDAPNPTDITERGFEYLGHSRSIESFGTFNLDMSPAGWAHLNSMPRLKKLTIERTIDFGEEELLAMKPLLQRLECFLFYDCDITDDDIGQLQHATQAEEISFFKCAHITGDGIQFLSKLKNLKRVLLNGTQVTKEEIADLQRQLPHCEILGPELDQ